VSRIDICAKTVYEQWESGPVREMSARASVKVYYTDGTEQTCNAAMIPNGKADLSHCKGTAFWPLPLDPSVYINMINCDDFDRTGKVWRLMEEWSFQKFEKTVNHEGVVCIGIPRLGHELLQTKVVQLGVHRDGEAVVLKCHDLGGHDVASITLETAEESLLAIYRKFEDQVTLADYTALKVTMPDGTLMENLSPAAKICDVVDLP